MKKTAGQGFNYVELTESAKGDSGENWFDSACKSGVQCDSLVISGHFGGSFFGSSGKGLSPSSMEKHTCHKSCPGILTHPKEVFLFGCNTLAGKTPDARTPRQYYQVLVDDGIPADVAERVTSMRYSPVGNSIKEQMQSVFLGVPAIYGFDSVGPSGKNVRSFLNRYFQSIPNYSNRLGELEVQKQVKAFSQRQSELNRAAEPWVNGLKGTNRSWCSGSNEMDQFRCDLHDDNLPTDQKLSRIQYMLRSPERYKYLLPIEAYLRYLKLDNLDENSLKILTEIKNDSKIRDEILAVVDSLSFELHTKISLLALLKNVGWIDSDQHQKRIDSIFTEIFKRGVVLSDKDAICSSGLGEVPLRAAIIPKSAYRENLAGEMIACSNSQDRKIVDEFFAVYKDKSANPLLREDALRRLSTIIRRDLPNDKIFWEVFDQKSAEPVGAEMGYALSVLVDRTPQNDTNTNRLMEFTRSEDPRRRELAVTVLSNWTHTKSSESFFATLHRASFDKSPEVRKGVIEALSWYGSDERFRVRASRRLGVFLRDPEASVRKKALRELSYFDVFEKLSPVALRQIESMARSANVSDRYELVDAYRFNLDRSANEVSLQMAIVELLGDTDQNVREATKEALRARKPTNPEVLQKIRSINSGVINWR